MKKVSIHITKLITFIIQINFKPCLCDCVGDRGNPGPECAKGIQGLRGLPGARGIPGIL